MWWKSMTCDYNKIIVIQSLVRFKSVFCFHFSKIVLFYKLICTQTWFQISCYRVDHQRYGALSKIPIICGMSSVGGVSKRTLKIYSHYDVIKWKYFPRYWWIPVTKASDVELWCFFYLCLNKLLRKHSWGWWFKTPSRSLWRYCNVMNILFKRMKK